MTFKHSYFFLPVVIVAFLFTVTSQAAQTTIQSCYDLVNINESNTPALRRELIVAIDKTVEFEAQIQEHTFQKIQQFLSAGDSIKIVAFSAYVQGNFTDIVFEGQLDSRLSDDTRYDIPKKALKKLDHCYHLQDRALRQGIGRTLLSIFTESSSKIPNTELIDNLNLIASSLYSNNSDTERYLLLVSDMMEHSSLTSFYKAGSLKNLSPESELQKIQTAGLSLDFNGTNIYVIGAAYTKKGIYRSGQALRNFQSFWQDFFTHSNAHLKAFGTPLLLKTIQ